MAHHIWCTNFLNKDEESCKMCKELKEKYPEDNYSSEELMKIRFQLHLLSTLVNVEEEDEV